MRRGGARQTHGAGPRALGVGEPRGMLGCDDKAKANENAEAQSAQRRER